MYQDPDNTLCSSKVPWVTLVVTMIDQREREVNLPNIDEHSGAFGYIIPFVLVIHCEAMRNTYELFVSSLVNAYQSTCPGVTQLAN